MKICKAIRNSEPSGSTSSKISSCTLNLMQNKAICNDLDLIVSFHSFFLFPHLKFLQIGDQDAGNTPSFLAPYMVVRYFCMLDDIGFIKSGGWKTHLKFEEYVISLNGLDDNDKK